MTDPNKVEIQVDAKAFSELLNSVKTLVGELQKVEKVSKNLTDSEEKSVKLKKQIEDITKNILDDEKKLDKLDKGSLKDLQDKYKELRKHTKELKEQEKLTKKAQIAFDKKTKGIPGTKGKGIEGIAKSLGGMFSGFKSGGVGGGIKGLGAGMPGGAGGALGKAIPHLMIANAIKDAIKSFFDFMMAQEKKIKQLNKTLMAGAGAIDMFGSSIGSVQDISSKMQSAVASGWVSMEDAMSSMSAMAEKVPQIYDKIGDKLVERSVEMAQLAVATGKSASQIGSELGDLFHQMSVGLDNVATVYEQFYTTALQSGIGANRFMGILQSLQGNLELFEGGMARAADTIKQFGANTNLTRKQAEELAGSLVQSIQAMGYTIAAFIDPNKVTQQVQQYVRGRLAEHGTDILDSSGKKVGTREVSRAEQLQLNQLMKIAEGPDAIIGLVKIMNKLPLDVQKDMMLDVIKGITGIQDLAEIAEHGWDASQLLLLEGIGVNADMARQLAIIERDQKEGTISQEEAEKRMEDALDGARYQTRSVQEVLEDMQSGILLKIYEVLEPLYFWGIKNIVWVLQKILEATAAMLDLIGEIPGVGGAKGLSRGFKDVAEVMSEFVKNIESQEKLKEDQKEGTISQEEAEEREKARLELMRENSEILVRGNKVLGTAYERAAEIDAELQRLIKEHGITAQEAKKIMQGGAKEPDKSSGPVSEGKKSSPPNVVPIIDDSNQLGSSATNETAIARAQGDAFTKGGLYQIHPGEMIVPAKAASMMRAMRTDGVSVQSGPMNVNISISGAMDPRAIALQIRSELEKFERNRALARKI